MGYLEKNFILHRRGADENLIPIDFHIVELDADVSMIPLTRGEILDNQIKFKEAKEKGIPSNTIWEEIISAHLVIPKMTISELHGMANIRKKEQVEGKPVEKIFDVLDLFIDALYKVSGIEMDTKEDIKKN